MANCQILHLLLLHLGRANECVHSCVIFILFFSNRVKENRISFNLIDSLMDFITVLYEIYELEKSDSFLFY